MTKHSFSVPYASREPHVAIFCLFSFFLAVSHGLWDLSSSTRNQTQALGSESSVRVLTTGPPGNSPQEAI